MGGRRCGENGWYGKVLTTRPKASGPPQLMVSACSPLSCGPFGGRSFYVKELAHGQTNCTQAYFLGVSLLPGQSEYKPVLKHFGWLDNNLTRLQLRSSSRCLQISRLMAGMNRATLAAITSALGYPGPGVEKLMDRTISG